MFKLFNFSSILSAMIHFIILTICASCIGGDKEVSQTVSSEVQDWKIPCDLSTLCTKKQLISSLNGPIEFRKTLKEKIDNNFNQFFDTYGNDLFYVCASLISVGGCREIQIDKASKVSFELYMKGLASCHHRLCHDYFQQNKAQLLKLANSFDSQLSLKSYYLMAVKLPLPWYDKADYLKKYLELIDAKVLKYEELGPLISAIPNHQGLKTFIAKRFFKIDENLDGVAVYLARYQNGWHDIYYKKFLASDNKVVINAFINSMPIGCPQISTILSFKDLIDHKNKKVLEETLNQEELDKYFSSLKLKSNKESKCLSSSPPAF
ncbi:hypothetical protein [Halobacteriovorax sp.]|uniref:hypothetical protein n=1 Tax=Halobacteriovorax sp. TaxID=2020862 RepID=UPI003AF2B52F